MFRIEASFAARDYSPSFCRVAITGHYGAAVLADLLRSLLTSWIIG
jgi:hypothetical protein